MTDRFYLGLPVRYRELPDDVLLALAGESRGWLQIVTAAEIDGAFAWRLAGLLARYGYTAQAAGVAWANPVGWRTNAAFRFARMVRVLMERSGLDLPAVAGLLCVPVEVLEGWCAFDDDAAPPLRVRGSLPHGRPTVSPSRRGGHTSG